MGRPTGYARVSTGERNLQLDARKDGVVQYAPWVYGSIIYSSSSKGVQELNTGNGSGRTLFGSLILKAISSLSKTFLTEMETSDVGMQPEQFSGNCCTDIAPAGKQDNLRDVARPLNVVVGGRELPLVYRMSVLGILGPHSESIVEVNDHPSARTRVNRGMELTK